MLQSSFYICLFLCLLFRFVCCSVFCAVITFILYCLILVLVCRTNVLIARAQSSRQPDATNSRQQGLHDAAMRTVAIITVATYLARPPAEVRL